MTNLIDEAFCDLVSMIEKKYPSLDIMQLGLATLTLGGLRSILGHEFASDTLRDYIHISATNYEADPSLKMVIDFMERELFGMAKSKIDIDKYKTCGKAHLERQQKYDE